MIDVNTLCYPDRCPRCLDRRVVIVDRKHGFWRCAPSALPLWAIGPGMALEHDATTDSDADEDDNDRIRGVLGMPLTQQGAT